MLLSQIALVEDIPAQIAFRAVAFTANGSGANKPAGLAVGDLVFVMVDGSGLTLTTASGSSWASDTLGSYQLFWKVLNATDVANSWGWGVSNIYSYSIAYIGNGATTVTKKSAVSNPSGQSSLVLPGFVVDPALQRGCFSAVLDSDGDSVVTPPPGFTAHGKTVVSSKTWCFAEAIENSYTGQDATWTGMNGTGTAAERGWLMEIT